MISSKNKVFALILLASFAVLTVAILLKSSPENMYTNTTYGFSFSYPKKYVLVERESNSSTEIVLIDKKESEMKDRLEGPVSLSIAVYKNIPSISLTDWLQKDESNFKLATTPQSFIAIAGQDGVEYEWDGLYRGRTVAFSYGDAVIVLAGTYLEKTDKIYSDFDSIVQSFMIGQKMVARASLLEHLKTNISKLSPEKEVLGGTFYVTELIVVDNEHATVFYEDGHNAYTAEVLFYVDKNGGIVVKKFTIVK